MHYHYDEMEDSLSIELEPGVQAASTVKVDDSRRVDIDASSRALRIEIRSASRGFRVDDLIERFELNERSAVLEDLATRRFTASKIRKIERDTAKKKLDPEFMAQLKEARIRNRAALDKLKDL